MQDVHDLMLSTTARIKGMYGYIKLIVLKSLSYYYISYQIVGSFSKFEDSVGILVTKKAVLKLIELVEKLIPWITSDS